MTQIAKRILENKFSTGDVTDDEESSSVKFCKGTNFKCQDFEELGSNYSVFGELKLNEFRIVNNKGNQWILSRNYDIICVKYFVTYPSKCSYFYGQAIADKKAFFDTPIDSSILLIYGAKNNLKPAKLYKIEDIACKLFCIPYCGSYHDTDIDEEFPPFDYVYVPLWHTL